MAAEKTAVSMHDHPTVVPKDISEIFEQKRMGRNFTGFEGLAASGLDCVSDNLMDGICAITSPLGWKWNDLLDDLGMRLCDLAHQSFMEHFEYAVKLAGFDHVGLGPDTLFGDHAGLHHAHAAQLSIKKSHSGLKFDEVPYVDGIENPADFVNIIRWLVKHGYSDEDSIKVMGGNALRVMEQVWIR